MAVFVQDFPVDYDEAGFGASQSVSLPGHYPTLASGAGRENLMIHMIGSTRLRSRISRSVYPTWKLLPPVGAAAFLLPYYLVDSSHVTLNRNRRSSKRGKIHAL
jgi:hypothetical protein